MQKKGSPCEGEPKVNCDNSSNTWQSDKAQKLSARQGRNLTPEILSAVARSRRRPITLPPLQFLENGDD
jgi:hypothetical protein